LDLLLTRFLAHRFDDVRLSCQTAFSELLEQQDPVIADWIWGRAPAPEGDLGEVIAMIRRDAGF
jgi:succinate dehydrogenase flavin-adding protein (antitoxin of CptAB toxin-antitoxin module)